MTVKSKVESPSEPLKPYLAEDLEAKSTFVGYEWKYKLPDGLHGDGLEVTFEIDANGIVNVSAQDKATGKAHNITIQASGGLDDNEIERMVKEAEDNAEADKEKREAIDVRNQAESMIHGAEKSLTDLGDKADPSAKSEVENAIGEVKTSLEGEDISTIKDKTSALSAVMMKMGEAAYKANQENPEDTDTSNENKEDVVDADFEEVKENEEKKDAS